MDVKVVIDDLILTGTADTDTIVESCAVLTDEQGGLTKLHFDIVPNHHSIVEHTFDLIYAKCYELESITSEMFFHYDPEDSYFKLIYFHSINGELKPIMLCGNVVAVKNGDIIAAMHTRTPNGKLWYSEAKQLAEDFMSDSAELAKFDVILKKLLAMRSLKPTPPPGKIITEWGNEVKDGCS